MRSGGILYSLPHQVINDQRKRLKKKEKEQMFQESRGKKL
jgi:hypothetical protein